MLFWLFTVMLKIGDTTRLIALIKNVMINCDGLVKYYILNSN